MNVYFKPTRQARIALYYGLKCRRPRLARNLITIQPTPLAFAFLFGNVYAQSYCKRRAPYGYRSSAILDKMPYLSKEQSWSTQGGCFGCHQAAVFVPSSITRRVKVKPAIDAAGSQLRRDTWASRTTRSTARQCRRVTFQPAVPNLNIYGAMSISNLWWTPLWRCQP